jgi:hypothetical protein
VVLLFFWFVGTIFILFIFLCRLRLVRFLIQLVKGAWEEAVMERNSAACAMEWSIELEKALRSKKPG